MLDYYRSADGRRFLLWQTLWLLIAALALGAVFGNGSIDLATSRWFFDGATRSFPLTNHALLKGVLHDGARTASALTALVLAALTATGWATPLAGRLHAYRRELLFAVGAAVAAAAAVAALKHFSGHACPWDLAAFGGTAPYHPLLHPGAAPAVRGCFPAAHPLVGYAWLAAGFPLYAFARRRARQWWCAAAVLGTSFGAVQVARGAHFVSHVLWSAWAVWAVSLALLAAWVWWPARAWGRRPVLAGATVQPLGNAARH
jgi:membrane-associated PAP2 superfamily phosphatase